jgi:uncharacterized glyoxalase superfamily protein PhnB
MPERDPIEQLDHAIQAVLRGDDVVGELLADLRALPRSDFKFKLRTKLMSTTAIPYIREGFHTLTPYLHPAPGTNLAEFLKTAFAAEEMFRMPRPDGTIMHAEFRIGDSILEMGEVPVDQPGPKATSLRTYVHNVDETYHRALAAGAVSLYEPVDQSYGDREAAIQDPAGNYWFVARPVRGDEYKHAGLQDVAPYLFLKDAAAFLEFAKSAFGARVLGDHRDTSGTVLHASVQIGDSIVGMGQAHGRWQPMPAGFHIYVANSDKVYEHAVAAGAVSLHPPVDQPYGERSASVADPEGNYWYIATRMQ